MGQFDKILDAWDPTPLETPLKPTMEQPKNNKPFQGFKKSNFVIISPVLIELHEQCN